MDMTVEVPELPELTFDEASHIYRLNGDIIPSVSKLMEPLKDQCYGGISKRTLENAAIKGSAVHNSIENWIDHHLRHRRERRHPDSWRGHYEHRQRRRWPAGRREPLRLHRGP